jgi:hypothetical protein
VIVILFTWALYVIFIVLSFAMTSSRHAKAAADTVKLRLINPLHIYIFNSLENQNHNQKRVLIIL